tara:strand:- start:270 stop:536 length:267 start_codon:yes stop_codon:yes gene_type:complete
MSLTVAKEHHIKKAAELNALQCVEMNEGVNDMKTEEMINYHMKRAVELRAQEIVEDREEPKLSVFIIFFVVGLAVGLVIGGAIAPLLL